MLLSELYGCFKTPNRDELIIHYSLQPAWGWGNEWKNKK
jgi:hypothetical protein